MEWEFIFDFLISTSIAIAISFIAIYLKIEFSDKINKYIMGITLGILGSLIIAYSVAIPNGNGFVLDSRSPYIFVFSYLFGIIPSIIGVLIMLGTRFIIGGEGLFSGIIIIFLVYGLGLLWKFIVSKRQKSYQLKTLILVPAILMLVTNVIFIFVNFLLNDLSTTTLLKYSWFYIFMIEPLILGVLIYIAILIAKRKKLALEYVEGLKYTLHYDSLTGVKNQNYFNDYVFKDFASPKLLVLCDIDGLGLINENKGRKYGNSIITQVAKSLEESVYTDEVFRWDDVDFLMICDLNDEKLKSKNHIDILQDIKDKVNDDLQDPEINISFGYSILDNNIKFAEAINISRALMNVSKIQQRSSIKNQILIILEKILDAKEIDAKNHATNMVELSKIFGKKLNLKDHELAELTLFARLHDIGKVGIDESILNKDGKLNEQEWEKIKTHAKIGGEILDNIHGLKEIAYLVKTHHEKWDGTGYPYGLKGEKIPYLSRVLAILDTYDVITRGRVYKNAISVQIAYDEINRCSGTQFDPELVEKFNELKKDLMI